MKDSGNYYGKDVSTFGSFQISGKELTGTANKVTGYEQFNPGNPDEQEGYYACLDIEPWQGVKIVSSRKPDSQVELKDDGIIVMFLGKESPDQMKTFDVIPAEGEKETYTVSVTAAD